MPSFKRIKEVRSILQEFPGIQTYKELDLLIEIGYHQELDCPLTLKQLLALGVASQATVRRYLDQLVDGGMVLKMEAEHDHRSVVLTLSDTTIENLLEQFHCMLDRLAKMDLSIKNKRRSKQGGIRKR